MPVSNLTTEAVEQSTYVIVSSFYNESGIAETPNSATWTLTDEYGTVINERADVAMTPGTSVSTLLSGDDLQILSSEVSKEVVNRIFSVEALYDSALQNNVPLKSSVVFQLRNLRVTS